MSKPRGHGGRHIVDILIEERAPHLASGALWPVARPPLYALLDYRQARAMADALAPLSGREALDYMCGLLTLDVSARGLEHIPERGRCMVLTNHPTGIADGIAMYEAVKARRPDVCFFANADALRVCPGFAEVLIPVEWPPEARSLQSSKETLRRTLQALRDERLIVIYPAGEIARMRGGALRDSPWEESAVAIARKHKAPIVPAHTSGPPPRLFLLLDHISNELRDITLFHELLNKKNAAYRVTFGPPMQPDDLSDEDATRRIQAFVEEVLAAEGFRAPPRRTLPAAFQILLRR